MTRLRQRPFALETLVGIVCGIGVGLLILAINLFNVPMRITTLIVMLPLGATMVLAVRNTKRLLLAAIFFDLALGIDFRPACVEHYFLSECGFNISVTLLALVGLYGLWLVDIRREQRPSFTLHPRIGTIGRVGGSFILVSLLSLTVAQNLEFSLYVVWNYVVLFALFFYLANHLHTQDDILFVVLLLAVGLLAQSVIMELKQLGLIGDEILLRFQNRVTGTFRSPNSAGAYLMQMILLLLPCLLLKIKTWQRWLLAVVLLFALYNLIGTESRGGWTGLMLGIAVIGVVSLYKRWLDIRVLMNILLVVIVVAIFFSAPIIARLTQDDNNAASARGPLNQIAWNMIQANPLVGVGWNNFGVVLFDYIEANQFGAWLNLVHNAWLLVWSETGTFSFLLFVAFWLVMAWQALKLIRKGQRMYALLALGILASLVGATSHMLVEIFASRILAQIVWTGAALLTAMARMQSCELQPTRE
jgi:O-antigen ligase